MLCSPVRWITIRFFVLGALLTWCWWQIRLLGDVRLHLGLFYGWFALACAGYLAALWCVHRIANESSGKRVRIALGLIVLTAVACRLLLIGTTPVLSDDIYRYRWDGRVQAAGIDPYAYAPNAPALAFLRDASFEHINFPQLRTVYPPLAELAFRVGVWIAPTLTAQKIVFVAAELMTCLCILFVLRRRNLNLLWVAAYAWHPLAILEVAGSGHNDALGIAMLWVGLAAWEARTWSVCALGWAAAFLSKFLSMILVPWWWCRRTARLWLIAFLAVAVLPLLLHPVAVTALYESFSVMTGRFASNASFYLLFAWLCGGPAVARLLSVGLGGGWLLWWALKEPDPIRYVLGGCGGLALLSPVLHPWYLLWLIPCFCFWRVGALIALTLTAVLSYTVWPGRLADGRWVLPLWAHLLEYAPLFVLGAWEMRRWWLGSSFRLATKPTR